MVQEPSASVGLHEFFFLRHGARLDQVDASWRQFSPTPYDTPISKQGVIQARLTGHAIVQHSSFPSIGPRKKRRYIIHTSPFLRCIQTALALATELGIGADRKPLLRLDCALGEWMNPEYYADIQAPPPMPELASHARYYLETMSRSPPTSPIELERRLFDALRLESTSNRRSAQEADSLDLNHVCMDWRWDVTQFGTGGEFGEEWPEMHLRFRKSLGLLLNYYSSNHLQAFEQDAIVVMVTHGAGCNGMIGAVTGRPVLTDVDISSLSHAIIKLPTTPSADEQTMTEKRKISHDYCLLMSASVDHLLSRSSGKRESRNSVGSIHGGWQDSLNRSASLTGSKGLWKSPRHSLGLPSPIKTESVGEQAPPTKHTSSASSAEENPRERMHRRGRQRSVTLQH